MKTSPRLFLLLFLLPLGLLQPLVTQAQAIPGIKRFFRTSPSPAVDSGFGASVASNGPLVVTGDPAFTARISDTVILNRGIVHVFNAATGSFIRSIEPPPSDRSTFSLQFGQSVALHGDLLAVGAPLTALNGTAANFGVYLYRASTGTFLRRITGPEGGFGAAVAIHGDRLLTGSPKEDTGRGAVYVHSISTGTQLARLTASDRAVDDAFGSAVALSPDYLLIGAPLDDTTRGANAGSGYLFENRPPFKQVRKLTDEGLSPERPTNANAQLGFSVAIRGQQLFLSAPLGDVPGDPDCGFVFEFIANRPTDLRQILPVFPQEIRGFGTSLSTSDDLLAIGPASDPNGFPSVLVLSLHNWESPQFAASLIPIGIEPDDQLGAATAIHGSSVYALTGDSPTPSQRGALFQLGPISRPNLPGLALFKTGASAPGVPGASISGDLAQLHDPSTLASHHLLTLSGPGASAVKGRGIWNQSAPTSPSLFPGQAITPSGSIASVTSFRLGGGILFAQGKVAGADINTSNDDVILAKLPNQNLFAAFSEGSLLPSFDSFTFVATQSFKAYAASRSGEASLIGKLRTGAGLFASTTAAADSFLATNNVQSPLPNASRTVREGDSTALNLGQFLPRVASGGSAHAFVTALPGPSNQNQAALLFDSTGPIIIAQKGNTARLPVPNAVFSAFLGESISSTNTVILRSLLTGSDITRSTNESLHLASRALQPTPCIRKGDIAPGFAPESNIRIAGFLSFQNTLQGGNVLFLARLTGPGVTSANDLALFVDVTDSVVAIPPNSPIRPSHLLLREGDPLPTSSKATIQTIHRIAYSDDGDYMALVSLVTRPGEATPADNLALLYGESRFTQPFSSDAEGFRKPFLLLRKGAHLAEYGGRPVKSLSFFPGTITPGGASGTGIGNVAGNGVPEWTLDLGNGLRASHHGGFNN